MITLQEIIQVQKDNFIILKESDTIKDVLSILGEKDKECFLVRRGSKYYCGSKNELIGIPLSRNIRDVILPLADEVSINSNIFTVIEKLFSSNKYIIVRDENRNIISILSSLTVVNILLTRLLKLWKISSLTRAIYWEANVENIKPAKLEFTMIAGRTEEIFGYNISAIKNDSELWFNSIHINDRVEVINTLKKVMKEKKPLFRTYRVCNKKRKKCIYLYEYIEPIIDTTGKVIGIAGISIDITEKERIYKKFENFQKIVLSFLNNINLIAILINEKGTILYVNNYLLKITGFKKNEIIGKSWYRILVPLKYQKEVKESFNSIIKNENIKTYSRVYPIKTKDKTLRVISWENTSIEILKNEKKTIKGIVAIGKDITEEIKKREEEEFINRISAQISQLQPHEALKEFYKILKENFNIRSLKIFYKQFDDKKFKYVFLKNSSKTLYTPRRDILKKNQRILNKVLEITKPYCLYNKIYFQKLINRNDLKAILCINPFKNEYINIINKILPILVSSFESFLYELELRNFNQKLQEEVEHRTFEIRVLYEISQKISYTLNYNELFKIILTHLHRVIKFDIAASILFTSQDKEIYIKLTRPTSEMLIQKIINNLISNLSYLSGLEALKKSDFIIYRLRSHKFKQKVKEMKEVKSHFYVPLIRDKKMIGLLYIGGIKKNAFTKDNLKIIYAIASEAAVSIQKLQFLLTDQQQQLKDVVENLPNALILLDNQHRIIMMNKEAHRILPMLTDSREGDILKNLGKIDINKEWENLQKLKEIVIYKPEHRHFYIQVRFITSRVESMNRWLIVIRDVTEIKHQEELLNRQERLASIGQLVGGIAHDFNNVLTTILATSEILLNEIKENKNKIYDEIMEIREAAQRASTLTRQLLAFSKRQVKPEIINVNDIINNLSKMLHRIIPENIILKMELSPELKLVKIDPVQLEQVIVNLAVNARDAMPDGGNLTIKTENVANIQRAIGSIAEDKEYICISIADTGVGIPDEIKQKIFEPFFTTKGEGKGTGLGLSTVYGIIRQSNGYIDFDSTPGKGTIFYIYLPVVSEQEIIKTKPLKKEIAITKGKGTILLVEDELFVQRATKRVLEKFGYNVIVASNGIEALNLFQKQKDKIDIIITDITMPQMSGIELIKQIKQLKPQIKYFYTSGYSGDTIDLPEFEKDKLLQKPFFIEELLKKIKSS